MAETGKKRRITGNDLIDGVLLLLAGLVLLLWPESALHVAVMVLGGALALFGLVRTVLYFRGKGSDTKELIVSLVLLALGVAMLCASGFFAGILYFAVGAMVAFGVFLMGMKVLQRGDRQKTILAAVFGVALLVLAVLIFIHPSSFGNFILRLMGIALLVEGASLLLVKPRQ